MNFINYLKIAAKNIHRRKLRSWLTVLGIVIGITAIVSLMIIGRGMENAVEQAFEDFGTDIVLIRGGSNAFGPPLPGEAGLTNDDKDTVNRVKGVDYAIPFLYDSATIEFHNEKIITSVAGYDEKHLEKFFGKTRFDLEKGRFFKNGESGVAIIGYRVQEDMFDDSVGLKNRLLIENKTFKIVGIMEEIGNAEDDFTIMTPLDDARDIFDEPDGITAMMAVMEPGVNIETVSERVKTDLKRARGDENFQVFTSSQLLNQITGVLAVIRIVLVGIAMIALVVGAIGIMNTMYMSVVERTREIGVMKSIGATNKDILGIFLAESAIFGVIGGLIGVGIGVGISVLTGYIISSLQLSIPFIVIIRPGVPIFAVIFAAVVGMASGFFPARNAAKMRPVDALRYE